MACYWAQTTRWENYNGIDLVIEMCYVRACFQFTCVLINDLIYCLQVTTLIVGHNCTSSTRRQITTPNSDCVASKGVVILRKRTNMGMKQLMEKLHENHKYKCVIINYDTVWKGRHIALKKLYGSWEDNFQVLFN